MIFECIISTRNGDGGTHIAPMGIHTHDEGYIIAPFKPSTTLNNLERTRQAVINYTDDVLVFAGCLTGRYDWPMRRAAVIDGDILETALAHEEVKVVKVEDDAQRPRFICKVVHAANHESFKGFNRAQAAVLEAAILTSRLHMLPAHKVDTELNYLRIAVEKTAGDREKQAWEWLLAHIADFRKKQNKKAAPL